MLTMEQYLKDFRQGVRLAIVTRRLETLAQVPDETPLEYTRRKIAASKATDDELHLVEVVMDYLAEQGLPNEEFLKEAIRHEYWAPNLPAHQGTIICLMVLKMLANQ
jgi:hypothetical protein